jgi:valyl-tRNA synthetase
LQSKLKRQRHPSPSFKPKLSEKTWQPSIELKVQELWRKERLFDFKLKARQKPFVIDTPPPYPSGRPWHVGAVAHYSQIDMIARTARMQGYNMLFPIGIDRNGLPVEIYTEKTYNISMQATPRDKFLELCAKALDELEAEMIDTMRRAGLGGDFEKRYRTDSDEYRTLTQSTFLQLWRKGLVYEASRPNNYCAACGTTIADAEVEYQEQPTKLVHIDFKVKESGESLTIATTRPELICSCQLVVVNPGDERYAKYHGMHAILPIYEREVEIRPHPSARPEFGTGVVMICSYGDLHDVQLFRELELQEIIAIAEDGKLAAPAGKYRGMSVPQAREQIIQDLQQLGLVKKIETVQHRIPFCERSGTPIEIVPMREYYLKQVELVPELRMLADQIKFHPPANKQILLDWFNAVSIDWPISRRRYYATEIPIWYCMNCGEPHIPKPGKYYRPWRDPSPFKKCRNCGSDEFSGENRTFDTWMDSSVSALFVTRYMRDKRFFKRTYPAAIRPQGKEIVRTWMYYSLLRCYQTTGIAPWRRAWIGGLGVDERGERMSKSKGNVIDPEPMLDKYGGDAFRFWNASEAALGSDFRCSEARIAGAKKFLTKLWNVSRFISSFPQPRNTKLMVSDRWILAELSGLTERCKQGYEEYNFFVPASEIRDFLWETFASHYVEMVKPRAYGQGFSKLEQQAAWWTLHEVLKTILLLLAPITPHIGDKVWRELYGRKSIHRELFPKAKWNKQISKLTPPLLKFNRDIWKRKEQQNLALRDPIKARIPKTLKPFARDLERMHYIVAK